MLIGHFCILFREMSVSVPGPFLIVQSFYYWVIRFFTESTYCRHESVIRYMLYKYFLQFYGLSFQFLVNVLSSTNFKILMKSFPGLLPHSQFSIVPVLLCHRDISLHACLSPGWSTVAGLLHCYRVMEGTVDSQFEGSAESWAGSIYLGHGHRAFSAFLNLFPMATICYLISVVRLGWERVSCPSPSGTHLCLVPVQDLGLETVSCAPYPQGERGVFYPLYDNSGSWTVS